MNLPLWVEHLLITFWCNRANPPKSSTHKGAFITNDFLRNPHFNVLHNILSLTAYYYESNENDDFYYDEDAVAGAALFALGALAIAG